MGFILASTYIRQAGTMLKLIHSEHLEYKELTKAA